MNNLVNNLYKNWLDKATDDEDLIEELKVIDNQEDEIYERFYTNLKFGTAGLRGILGAGTNRMNVYTVRQATQGLANFLNKTYKNPAVAIAYDSRIKAALFADECAKVLTGNDIKVYLTKELQPTPVLSFAVRNLKCQSGIMITASHNPAKYNGYKCYGSDGCQMPDAAADAVYEEIKHVDYFNDIKLCELKVAQKQGLLEYIGDDLYDRYIEKVKEQSIRPGITKGANLKVVYTPLNGAGNKLVRRILNEIGVYDIVTVREQEFPDGNFTTCPYPNPEIHEALQLAMNLADEVNPDLVLATDPDSDRVGIAVKNNGKYVLISGNEDGVMMFNYICNGKIENGTMPQNPVAVKTIVTTEMVSKIADEFSVDLRNVLTGFKWIGDQIHKLEDVGEENRYIFGFEESYGYLAGSYVRDKDAVVASMLICEMAAYYKKTQGKNLVEVLNDLYDKYGYYKNKTLSFEFEGASGMEKMKSILENLRKNPLSDIAGIKVVKIEDYKLSLAHDVATGNETEINLPKSNVLKYTLQNGAGVVVRPSGTEPKVKVYMTSIGDSLEQANKLINELENYMTKAIKG